MEKNYKYICLKIAKSKCIEMVAFKLLNGVKLNEKLFIYKLKIWEKIIKDNKII